MDEEKTSSVAYLVDLVANSKKEISKKRCRVGTANDNEIVFADKTASPLHFFFTYDKGIYCVQNANKSNKTYLNGEVVDKSVNIKDGDVLKAGQSLFWFVEERM